MSDDIYVVVANNDKPHKLPGRKEPFFDGGGPLIFEQYTRSADLESITKRKQQLEQSYGKCRIAKLVFMEEI